MRFLPLMLISLISWNSFAQMQVQYFKGSVQTSSPDGKTPYGPAIETLISRSTDFKSGKILEMVNQRGKEFVTLMTRSNDNPLVFLAKDTDGSFTGKLTYADETLSSWSYAIDVVSPSKGKITGSLPSQGATISSDGKSMHIVKFWQGADGSQALLTEDDVAISSDEYFKQLNSLFDHP